MERLPNHIHQLVSDLQAGFDVEASLATASRLASFDFTLLNILVQFGYSFESNSFIESPSAAEVIKLLLEEYSSPILQCNSSFSQSSFALCSNDELLESFKQTVYDNQIDQFATCSELGLEPIEYSWSLSDLWGKDELSSLPKTPVKTTQIIPTISPSTTASMQPYESESDSEAIKSTRGLRHLTSLVKEVVSSHQSTSYKEVAVKLIKKLIVSRGSDRLREEKNVRRRVYDAINVLIAAGILEKHGKRVTWREEWDSIELDDLNLQYDKRLTAVKDKRAELSEALKRYISMKHLLHRNSQSPPQSAKVSFPFIIVSTNDNQFNSVTTSQVGIHTSQAATSVKLKFAQHMTLLGDVDILMKLKMFKVEKAVLLKLLPDQELLKYCNELK